MEPPLLAELAKTEQSLATLKKAHADFAASASRYQEGRIQQLTARLNQEQAALEAANARLVDFNNTFVRANDLSARGIQTAANLDHARSGYEVAKSELEVARERLSFLKVELEAAKFGTFLGDSYNDAPYSQQRERDLKLKVEEEEITRRDISRRLSELEPYLDLERLRFNDLRLASITSPTGGVMWELPAQPGETVRKGQDLVRLVDCNARIITASVSERLYNKLRVGSPARFRLLGSDRAYEATVMRLAGPASLTRYANLAVSPQSGRLAYFDVVLASEDLNNETDQDCRIGQSGKVQFSSGSFGFMNSIKTLIGF